MLRVRSLSLAATVAALGGCVAFHEGERRTVATAMLVHSDGSPAGTARLLRDGATLLLRVEAYGLAPGPHGLHLHSLGRCDPPSFASAQGHWNPSSRQHGSANPAGPHGGDQPNLIVGTDGHGELRTPLNDQAGAAGLGGILDADGTAVVIHAEADDLRTDPSGASGARIACGVLKPT
jgi:Cu-Zn family superoxide dismutase